MPGDTPSHVWTHVPLFDVSRKNHRSWRRRYACRCGAWAELSFWQTEVKQLVDMPQQLEWQDPTLGCGPAPTAP